ncbi:hypothetical protein LCGC14_1575230 [marine sediment metagenome]|uniref:Uncharacterized protein n=1 Tax=marine sediment metagenome TaxID=412755 RepID=A0A0F9J4P3_9ZZZZ
MSETEEMASSRLPMLQADGGDGKRADYLSKRVCNFSMRESCKLANVSEKSVRRWREADPNFLHLDTEGITDLRKKLGNELIDMEYTRNFHLVLQKDFKVLYKDAIGSTLTEDETAYLLKVIRKHYTPQDIIAVDKAMQPDGDAMPPGSYRETLTVTVEGRQVEDESARRAAARDLLERFESNKRIAEANPEKSSSNGEKALEGEVLE